MAQITTNTITSQVPESRADEYIVQPLEFATLWKDITGRAAITDADISNIKALARFFGAGLAITRNNHTD